MPPLTVESYRIEPHQRGLGVEVKLMPAQNVMNSILLVAKDPDRSGLSAWITRTQAAMTPEQHERNRLITHGLYGATLTDREWDSFLQFVDHLAASKPEEIINNIAESLSCKETFSSDEFRQALATEEEYLTFVKKWFESEELDLELEAEAYDYLSRPKALQDLLVSYLRDFWDTHMAGEWQRVEPVLLESVRAFQQVDFTGMDTYEVVKTVTGRELEREKFNELFGEDVSHLLFVPSPHLGPYITITKLGEKTVVFFGARLPQGATYQSPDLSRAEIYNRLNALADETRLAILKYIADNGELRSQEVMTQFNLSQPMASRHLVQLSANGFLLERRCDGSKCYRLNPGRIRDTLQALSSYLLDH